MFVAVWSDLIQARGDSHWGVQKLSGGIQPMRTDFHRVDGPAGTRRFQDAAVVEGEATSLAVNNAKIGRTARQDDMEAVRRSPERDRCCTNGD